MTQKTLLEVLRFGLVGASVLVLHLAFVYMLTEVFGWWYLVATVFSYTGSMILNFLLQKFYVRADFTSHATNKQFLLFALLSVSHLGTNALLMYIFVSVFHLYYLLAQAGIVLFLSFVTFYVNRRYIFTNTGV